MLVSWVCCKTIQVFREGERGADIVGGVKASHGRAHAFYIEGLGCAEDSIELMSPIRRSIRLLGGTGDPVRFETLALV